MKIINITNIWEPMYKLVEDCKQNKIFSYDQIWTIGARAGGKTFNGLFVMILIGLLCKTKIFAIRLIDADMEKTIRRDIISLFKQHGFKYRIYKKVLYFGKGSEIHFESLKKSRSSQMSFSGLANTRGFDRVIIIKDEVGELEENENLEVDEAIRGAENFKIFELRTSNPFEKQDNWYANKIMNILGKNYPNYEEIVKEKGFINFEYTDGLEKIWICITAAFINRYVDRRIKIKLLQEAQDNPLRANTSLYGLSEIPKDAVYKINQVLWNNGNIFDISYQLNLESKDNLKIKKWTIGIDYGKNDKSGMVLMAHTNKKFYIVDCFVNDNKIKRITDPKLIDLMVLKIKEWIKKYNILQLMVRYDWSAPTFAQFLQQPFLNDEYRGKIFFNYSTAKRDSLDSRIKIWRMLWGNGLISFNKDNFASLVGIVNCFKNIKIKENDDPQKIERYDGKDDEIQMCEYSIYLNEIYDIFVNNGIIFANPLKK